MATKTQLIRNLNSFLQAHIVPFEQQLDVDSELMCKAFIEFKDQQFFSMYIPRQFGGIDLSIFEKIEIQELLGMLGGAFSFLQVQTGTASWLIQQGDNLCLKRNLLPQIASGKRSVGNCTYQMKPNHRQHLVGTKCENGYRLTGKLDLTSGFGMFDDLVIGFHSNNQEIFAIIPYQVALDYTLIASNVISAISMTSINTVSLTFNEYFLPMQRVIVHWSKGTFFRQYRRFPPFAYPLGIAKQALLLANESPLLERPALRNQYRELNKKLNNLKQQILLLPPTLPEETSTNDMLLSQIAKISLDSLNFSIFISGGPGLLSTSPVQRLYRELTVWLIPRAYPEVIEKIFQNANL